MQLTHYLSVALLLAVVPFRTAQDGKKPDETKPAKPLSDAAADALRIKRDIIGAWRLVRAETAGENFSGGSCRGAMLVVDGYMSINAQLDSATVYARGASGELFSSAAYRWRYDGDRLLLTTTTMVSVDNFTPDDRVQYEPPGARREYRVELADNSLTLTRDTGGRLLFTRLEAPTPEQPATKR